MKKLEDMSKAELDAYVAILCAGQTLDADAWWRLIDAARASDGAGMGTIRLDDDEYSDAEATLSDDGRLSFERSSVGDEGEHVQDSVYATPGGVRRLYEALRGHFEPIAPLHKVTVVAGELDADPDSPCYGQIIERDERDGTIARQVSLAGAAPTGAKAGRWRITVEHWPDE
jgi:hypothetical protein